MVLPPFSSEIHVKFIFKTFCSCAIVILSAVQSEQKLNVDVRPIGMQQFFGCVISFAFPLLAVYWIVVERKQKRKKESSPHQRD